MKGYTISLLLSGTALLLAASVAASSKCLDSQVEGLSTDDDFPTVLHAWYGKILKFDGFWGEDHDSCDGEYYLRTKRSIDYGYASKILSSRGTNGGGYQRLQFRYDVPKPTYRKSFQEGKWQLVSKQMIKNYYKKGTYEMAKKFFIALPFVKIIPVKTTTSVDYVVQLQTYDSYRVRLCEHCYDGHPQIEFQSLSRPHRNVIRRVNFLPYTKRSRTEYGKPKITQIGQRRVVSHGTS
ncbi:uncharacterized protein LOC124253641 [Haliotis rubra]|uniref:uncharacterized protein LOC124253641 n=1 Tax=Haliotis rubra TaxID=36100 RepID=UPI001EE5F162|nr:uncharacterized protein LOC124253641 [Haliotis rubra]